MVPGRRAPRRLRAAKRASAASGQAVNFMAETIAQDHARGERLSALGQHHGQQQEGHDGHVVAPRGQREGRGGQDGDHLQGAHLAATVGRAEPQGHRRDQPEWPG